MEVNIDGDSIDLEMRIVEGEPATISHVRINGNDRLYENIVDEEKGVYNEDGSINVNPNSLTVIKEAYVEPELEKYDKEDSFQFMRTGYFCLDSKDSTKEHMVFNRIVSLKSSYKPN